MKFKDKLLWQWFNCKAAELKGYPLPEAKDVEKKAKAQGYGKKPNRLMIG